MGSLFRNGSPAQSPGGPQGQAEPAAPAADSGSWEAAGWADSPEETLRLSCVYSDRRRSLALALARFAMLRETMDRQRQDEEEDE